MSLQLLPPQKSFWDLFYLLTVGVTNKKSKEEVIFFILNETKRLIPYQHAFLWKIHRKKKEGKLLAISGNLPFLEDSFAIKKWGEQLCSDKLIEELIDSREIIFDTKKILKDELSYFWQPLLIEKDMIIALCLSKQKAESATVWKEQEISFLHKITSVYANCLRPFFSMHWLPKMKLYSVIGIALFFLLSFVIHIPLRIVSPCEIIPQNPYVITAPLDGIILKIHVDPGQQVKKGDIIFSYDKEAALQSLRVSSKQVEMIQTAHDQSLITAFEDEKALAEIRQLSIGLEKEQLALEFAQYQANRLEVFSPIDGIAIFQHPEMWRGSPVQIGERILIIANPQATQVKIWIPEDDMITLNEKKEGKIFLHPQPNQGYPITVRHISQHTSISDRGMSSFLCEADWGEKVEDIPIGMRGTAILYGEEVSLFYWIFRRPWIFLRQITGI